TDHPIRMAIAIKVGYSSPGRPGNRWHREGIDLVVSGVVNTAASDNARIPFPRAGHHFIGSAAGVNHGASVSIVCVQPLVASAAGPDESVIRAVRRGNKHRAQSALSHAPRRHYGRRLRGSTLISG